MYVVAEPSWDGRVSLTVRDTSGEVICVEDICSYDVDYVFDGAEPLDLEMVKLYAREVKGVVVLEGEPSRLAEKLAKLGVRADFLRSVKEKMVEVAVLL